MMVSCFWSGNFIPVIRKLVALNQSREREAHFPICRLHNVAMSSSASCFSYLGSCRPLDVKHVKEL